MGMDVQTLLHDLGDRDTNTYYAARDQIRALGIDAVPALAQAMLSGKDIVSWRAATLLTEIKVSAVMDYFVQALESPNTIVRQIAAQTIGEQGDKRLVPHLLKHLDDRSCIVQMWIVEALGELGDSNVVQSLLALLQRTDSTSIQLGVIKALGQIGDDRAVEALLPFLQSDNHHVRSKAQRVYRQLIESSGKN
jgi:HEAT repeat protein